MPSRPNLQGPDSTRLDDMESKYQPPSEATSEPLAADDKLGALKPCTGRRVLEKLGRGAGEEAAYRKDKSPGGAVV